MLYKELDNLHVAVEGCEVQGCESIVTCARCVDPLFEILLSFLVGSSILIDILRNLSDVLQHKFTDDSTGLIHVLIRSVVNW